MDKQSFSRTFAALDALRAETEALNRAVLRMRENMAAKAEADSRAEDYRTAAADTIARLNQTIAKIDTVLNENGSNYNHD